MRTSVMRLKRIQMTKAVNLGEAQTFYGQSDSDQHTSSKRQRSFSPTSENGVESSVGLSGSESILTDRDDLLPVGPSRRKRGSRDFKRPRIKWELVSLWNKDHVAQDDYQGAIAGIMAKSL